MMKISELKDERAIYSLGEMIEPLAKIMADNEIVGMFKSGQKLKAVSALLKKYPEDVVTILAAADGVDKKDYHCNLLTLPAKILEIVNDPEIIQLFTFAETKTDGALSVSALGNTAE